MTYTVTITSQGQISIPIKIREELGLSKSKKALVSIEDGRVIVEPVKDFLEFRGSLRTKKRFLSTEELHEYVAKSVAVEYSQKINKTR
jgi:AbrB family looped-hinge helix DNA binding protein